MRHVVEVHIEVQDHTAFINGMPFQTHTSFPEWEALKLAIEQAALSAHGAHIQLIGKFSAIKELDAYLRRVAWIRERAFERGHDDRSYSYLGAWEVFGDKRMNEQWQNLLLSIWRLLITHFNGRWEVRCA